MEINQRLAAAYVKKYGSSAFGPEHDLRFGSRCTSLQEAENMLHERRGSSFDAVETTRVREAWRLSERQESANRARESQTHVNHARDARSYIDPFGQGVIEPLTVNPVIDALVESMGLFPAETEEE